MNFPTKKENEKGFTLAELLIVVAIIAVLVAIAIPIFSAQLEKSNRAVDMQTARSVQSALGVAYSQGRITVPANLQNRPNAQGVWVTICRDENSKPVSYGKNGTAFCGADQGVIIDGKKASGGTGTSNKQAEKLLAECGLDPANLSLKSNGKDDGWDWIVIDPYTDASATSRFTLDSKSDKGYIPQTAFGQGDTLITPLHNAMIVSTIANGGLMMKPYMIDSVENYKGKRVKKFSPSSYDTLMTSEEVDTLTGYMRKVVTQGTAADYFAGASYEAAGKTGTAEYANGEHDFSWFIGFTSVDHPEVAVSIVVEESDVNGVKATAIARKMFDTYYSISE